MSTMPRWVEYSRRQQEREMRQWIATIAMFILMLMALIVVALIVLGMGK